MNKKIKINHTILGTSIAVAGLVYCGYLANNYISVTEKIAIKEKSISTLSNEISHMNNEINKKAEQVKKKDADLSYYASSIYAYGILENIQVEIKNIENKFRNTARLHVSYPPFEDNEKFKDFIKAVSLLGFVENIKASSLEINVGEFSIQDAKNKLLNLSTNNRETK